MKNSEEFNTDIKREFDKDIEMPESLSKNNMVKMLKEKGKQEKKTKVKILPKVLSAAAMLIVIAIAAVSIGLHSEFVPVDDKTEAQDTAQTATTQSAVLPEAGEETTTRAQKNESFTNDNLPVPVLKTAKSREDIENYFLKLYAENKIDDYIDTVFNGIAYGVIADGEKSADAAVNENAAETAAPAAPTMAATAQSNTGSVPYGTTNTQVADVDEGDIIKNDGKYLYVVNSDYGTGNNKLTIVNAETMRKVYEGTVMPEEEDEYLFIRDIYVNGDILTAVCGSYPKTYAIIYDITERHAPKEIRRVDQDGNYTSSRMVDGILYTVTDYTVRGSSAEEVKENAVPSVGGTDVRCDCCYIVDEESTSYIVVSAFDTTKEDSEIASVSVLGNGCNIYSTSKNLYVYSYEYAQKEATEYTRIYSFSIDGTQIKHKATGSVVGNVINQYSFDEYEGYLRVATTRYDYRTNIDVSSVYVLNSKLEKVGEVINLADDEQVKAVRFMGDTSYVVTFRNTDPLFILDLADPTNPTVVGELKIPGYSAYIHPIGDNYLVGIGYDGTDENVISDSVKVSVFDVSDKSNPIETDTFVIKNAYSLVNSDPKAFFWYAERKLVGIPVTFYNNSGTVKSIQTLKIEDGKISSDLGYIHYSETPEVVYGSYGYYYDYDCYYANTIFRGTYIGNKLYTIDDFNVLEHDLDSGEMTRSCVIGTAEVKKENSVTADTTSHPDDIVPMETTSFTIQ